MRTQDDEGMMQTDMTDHWDMVDATGSSEQQAEKRPLWRSLRRGWLGRCPQCGAGKLFRRFLKTDRPCGECALKFDHHRADDAPPYFTILVVAHIVVPLLLFAEQTWAPPMWLHYLLWLPLTVILCLIFLPRIKGALVGLQWCFRMHGFADEAASNSPE